MSNPLEEFVLRYGPKAGEEGAVRFVKEVLGVKEVDPWQENVLRAFGRGERRISIRACHGPGKTAVGAWLVCIMLCTRFPQLTAATAPSKGQLEDALIKEIKIWLGRTPQVVQNLFEVKSTRIELRAAPEESFFTAATARAETPEALQGKHSENVLLLVDEASGVPEQVFEAAAGSMSGHNATTVLLSNPVRTSGFFFDTHHKLADMWFTVHISYKDSPRVTEDFARDIARRYGENSNAYRVRVLGEFPAADLDTIIPYEYVYRAQQRKVEESDLAGKVWGVDVGRFGDDSSALIERTKRCVTRVIEWDHADTMQSAGRIKELWDRTMPKERPNEILVDVVGLGAGVLDRLRELGLPARGVNVGESASTKERFVNLRTELWWEAREWLASLEVSMPEGEDQEDPRTKLARELVVPKYGFTSSGKVKAETKDEMRKRGYRSPNIADAMCLTFAASAASLMHGSAGSSNWTQFPANQPIKRNRAVV